MKKLLSLLTVAAIVTSTFAFTMRGEARFCVREEISTGTFACRVIPNKFISSQGDEYFHYKLEEGFWDGSTASCNNANPLTNCNQSIFLDED